MAGSTRIPDTFCLDGESVIGTDSSHGIGRALARCLAGAGADVAVPCEMPLHRAERLLDKAKALDRDRACVSRANIGTPENLSRMAAVAGERFDRIDSPVNDAGTAHNATDEDVKLDELEQMIRINLAGVYLSCQAVGRLMIRQLVGLIVKFRSLSARMDNYVQKRAHYNTAKARVHLLRKCLAVEWAPHNNRLDVLVPGYIRTELLDPIIARDRQGGEEHWRGSAARNRFGRPEEPCFAVVCPPRKRRPS